MNIRNARQRQAVAATAAAMRTTETRVSEIVFTSTAPKHLATSLRIGTHTIRNIRRTYQQQMARLGGNCLIAQTAHSSVGSVAATPEHRTRPGPVAAPIEVCTGCERPIRWQYCRCS